MKTITEIREITKSNQILLDEALSHIEHQAEQGYSCCLFSNLSEENFIRLINYYGYKGSTFLDPMNIPMKKIEW